MRAVRFFSMFFFFFFGVLVSQAQITITASGVNIADGIEVGASGVQIGKKLILDGVDFSTNSAYIRFELPRYGLRLGNGIESGSIIQPTQMDENPASSPLNPNQYNMGFILPETANFMDLGSPKNYFRRTYTKDIYYKNVYTLSDARQKENVENLGNAMEILQELRPVSFDFKADSELNDTGNLKNKVGFIAQEVESVLPGIVGHLPGIDLYAVDYVSLIPYLVKALQEEHAANSELREQIAYLQQKVDDLAAQMRESRQDTKKPKGKENPAPEGEDKTVGIGDGEKTASGRLFQNAPNPFSETSIIRYVMKRPMDGVSLRIFNMSGRLVCEIPIRPGEKEGRVEVSAGQLSPGMYTYSLIAGGEVLDSKKMVVTE